MKHITLDVRVKNCSECPLCRIDYWQDGGALAPDENGEPIEILGQCVKTGAAVFKNNGWLIRLYDQCPYGEE